MTTTTEAQSWSTTAWTAKEHQLASRRIRGVLRDHQVPPGLRDDIHDEALALCWAYLSKHGSALRATLTAWAHSKDRTLASPDMTTIRAAARKAAFRAMAGAKLVKTKPHGKYRDAMGGAPNTKRIGLEEPRPEFRPVLEYLEESIRAPEPMAQAPTVHQGDVLFGLIDRLPKCHQPLARRLANGQSQRDISQSRNVSRRQVHDECQAMRPSLERAWLQGQIDAEDALEAHLGQAPTRLPIPGLFNAKPECVHAWHGNGTWTQIWVAESGEVL